MISQRVQPPGPASRRGSAGRLFTHHTITARPSDERGKLTVRHIYSQSTHDRLVKLCTFDRDVAVEPTSTTTRSHYHTVQHNYQHHHHARVPNAQQVEELYDVSDSETRRDARRRSRIGKIAARDARLCTARIRPAVLGPKGYTSRRSRSRVRPEDGRSGMRRISLPSPSSYHLSLECERRAEPRP